jgi:hypothetical protein
MSVSSSGAEGNDASLNPTLSAGGPVVAFESFAAKLGGGCG